MGNDLPVHRTALATGVAVSWVATGPVGATPVLLLHSWGESHREFSRLLPLLPDTVRAVAPDQRGHGEADRPQEGYALQDLAADVVALLDALGLASAVLLGSSSGGYVAQQVALHHPHRVLGLVLVGSPRSLQGRPPFAEEVEGLSDPVDPAWVRNFLGWFPTVQPVPQWYVEESIRHGAAIPARVRQLSLEGLSTAVPPTEAGTITVPTLVLRGACDGLLPRDHTDALVAAIPGARLVVYEDTGHLVTWERPERVAADLVRFVDDLGR